MQVANCLDVASPSAAAHPPTCEPALEQEVPLPSRPLEPTLPVPLDGGGDERRRVGEGGVSSSPCGAPVAPTGWDLIEDSKEEKMHPPHPPNFRKVKQVSLVGS